MSPVITPEDLPRLPDHTEVLETILNSDAVDALLPQYMGNANTGRFVVGFFLIANSTVRTYVLKKTAQRKNPFDTIYEFTAAYDIDTFGEFWENTVVFSWDDRVEAHRSAKILEGYAARFTLDNYLTEEEIKNYADETVATNHYQELPQCDCRVIDEWETIQPLHLNIADCSNCFRPLCIEFNQECLDFTECLDIDWIDPDQRTIIDGSNDEYYITVSSESKPTQADVTLHALTRLSHREFDNFDFYTGREFNGLLYVHDGRVKGHLLWNTIGKRVFLQQVYVLPGARQTGNGAALVNTWFTECCPANHYYASTPNKAGLRTLKHIGHVTDDHNGPAIPAYAMTTSSSMDADETSPASASDYRRANRRSDR